MARMLVVAVGSAKTADGTKRAAAASTVNIEFFMLEKSVGFVWKWQ